jgi:hypothetical protein
MTTIFLLGQRQVIKRSAHTAARKKLARCLRLVQRRRRSELCCAQSECVQQGGAGAGSQVKLFLFARTPLHNTHLKSFEIASAAHLLERDQ